MGHHCLCEERSDEAISSKRYNLRDCFASLTMTYWEIASPPARNDTVGKTP